METSSSQPPKMDAASARQKHGCYGAFLGTLLVVLPPVGLGLLGIKSPWPKTKTNAYAIASTLWFLGLVFGCFWIPKDAPREAQISGMHAPVDSATELAEFKSVIDKAIEIKSAITDLDESVVEAQRSGDPMNHQEFAQE